MFPVKQANQAVTWMRIGWAISTGRPMKFTLYRSIDLNDQLSKFGLEAVDPQPAGSRN